MKKLGLLPKLAAGIIAGMLVGTFLPKPFIEILATFNGIFGNFLNFAIPLIIIGFVVPGIGDLGKGAGKTLAITALLAYSSTILAGTLAFFTCKTLFPKFLQVGSMSLAGHATNPEGTLVKAIFRIEMPPVMDVMTALILSFTLGLGIAVIKGTKIKEIFGEFQEIITKLIENIIIPLLPVYVMGIFANMTYTGEVYKIMSVFAQVFVVIISLHFIYILFEYVVAGVVAKKNPFELIKNMLPAYMTSLGTQSSAASIPVTLKQTLKNGVGKDVAEFVVPLCATIHLPGSTITITSCAIAIMLLNGVPITFGSIMPFVMMLGVTMVAAPGVPGGAIMAALGVLQSMLGFNDNTLSLMIALYLAQDSFGTACNVTGDSSIALLVTKFNEKFNSTSKTV